MQPIITMPSIPKPEAYPADRLVEFDDTARYTSWDPLKSRRGAIEVIFPSAWNCLGGLITFGYLEKVYLEAH